VVPLPAIALVIGPGVSCRGNRQHVGQGLAILQRRCLISLCTLCACCCGVLLLLLLLLLQSTQCACAVLGQVNDLLGNKFKSAVLSRLAGGHRNRDLMQGRGFGPYAASRSSP